MIDALPYLANMTTNTTALSGLALPFKKFAHMFNTRTLPVSDCLHGNKTKKIAPVLQNSLLKNHTCMYIHTKSNTSKTIFLVIQILYQTSQTSQLTNIYKQIKRYYK